MLAASLIQGGMNWKQAVPDRLYGNTIRASRHAAEFGIPGAALWNSFPVLARASFRRAGRERGRRTARSGGTSDGSGIQKLDRRQRPSTALLGTRLAAMARRTPTASPSASTSSWASTCW